ncbi:DMT family transporter [Bdellovibrio sp. SKB1291214]|uniref:DMT family transporter n=1 Tax=Bdellovibrio sp. SKB1291214 TaxID=1732569 RepID=UPI000B517701|nr:DMT family transporter [Bdellovibrio sp. SKB1291214]UYL10343.1 DMT family transporter [Bdellovibrio sp. SKB1291214]
MNFLLYAICTLIWGSTWLVITFQVDSASPIASVFWRFSLGALILLSYCLLSKKKLAYGKADHLKFMTMGLFMFSINYMLVYWSETMVSSGIAAICFTVIVPYNMLGMRLFFKKPITSKVIFGSLLGGTGICLIFINEVLGLHVDKKTVFGLVLGLIATLLASAGNMLSQRSYRKAIPVVVSNTWGMLYGSLFTLIVGLVLQHSFAVPLTTKYLSSLMYLSLFGSVFAFGAYLSLAGRIGAERAAYSGVVSPVIALTLSSMYENFKWTPYIIMGVAFCLLGNILTLYSPKINKARA